MICGEPQPIINKVGILQRHPLFKTQLLFGEGHRFQRFMSGKQYCRRGRLVNLPRLYAHQPILHVVDASHTMLAGQLG